jgi:hypothetical protein
MVPGDVTSLDAEDLKTMNVSGILRRRIRIRSHTSGKSGPALLLERYEFAVDHSANGQR